jgi:diaminopimelate epimerase
MRITFWKWEGAGNDFILFDRRDWEELPDVQAIHSMCSRTGKVGADGVIFFRPVTACDAAGRADEWEMDYLNADGSRSFCGNGSRALFAFLLARGLMPATGGKLHACDGEHAVRWHEQLDQPGVQMRSIARPRQVLSQTGRLTAHFVDTGSPHHIEWIDSGLEVLDVADWGQRIRMSEAYKPGGTNVDFVEVLSAEMLRMRTFERGVEAETKACGTGATAAALADYMERGGNCQRQIHMSGGTLHVDLGDARREDATFHGVWLFGAAREMLSGTWSHAKGFMCAMLLAWMLPMMGFAGSWTDEVQVSVLTGSPGPDLYSAWGHTAIRVLDMGQTPPVDWTYSYGTFEFGEGFYLRFLRGELNYRLSKSPYVSLQREYAHFGRAILEQPLDLKPEDARAMVDYLEWNYLPENRVYAYRFFEDNCSFRVIHVMEEVFGERWDAHCEDDPASGVTYREAHRPYVHEDPWVEAGIDLILGPRADRVMPPCGSSFLPDGLMHQLTLATLDGQHIAANPKELLPPQQTWFRSVGSHPFLHPQVVAGWVLVWTFVWALRRLIQQRKGRRTPRWERRMGKWPLVLAGTLGVLLCLMWGFTDHRDTWGNWNLIWASPLLPLLATRQGSRAPWQEVLRAGLVLTIPLFLLLLPFAPQFVSLTNVLLAWAVWLSLDPWQLPRGLRPRPQER